MKANVEKYDYYKVHCSTSERKRGWKSVRVLKGTPFCHWCGIKASLCSCVNNMDAIAKAEGRA